ncbi:MAG: SCO family protein [Zoogloeaceae bacterium]|nr:SCO family protein [Rhodocyclaceae bacterium]MCP5236595.1 SCO family protein [Zoogloeaceae bacterium]
MLALALAVTIAGGVAAADGEFHAKKLVHASEHPFQLPDQDGTLRSSGDFKGRVVLIFFGFTHCPDVCPTELARLADVLDRLTPELARQVQVIFVTLDPVRDTPELLRGYVAAFSPDFMALRGSEAETAALAEDFRVFYRRIEGSAADRYMLEHSAYIHAIDKQGRLRLRIPGSLGTAEIASDVRRLLAE